jgi:phosphoribosylformimino-5-aminoimidazole carboxamide ribotide isomerase
MKIIPAIDLKGGLCVRLKQGRADDETVYSSDPVETALRWQDLGAEYLHVVDLDGAFKGEPVHTDVIASIAAALRIPIEVGGGLRTDKHVEELLNAGAARAILGTRAAEGADSIEELIKRYGDAIAVGIDASDGFVQVRGWVETTTVRATDLAKDLAEKGLRTIIYTDTSTDGMLVGPNLEAVAEMAASIPDIDVIASGGVKAPSDVTDLKELNCPNIIGVIIGKALYENPRSLPEYLDAAGGTTV